MIYLCTFYASPFFLLDPILPLLLPMTRPLTLGLTSYMFLPAGLRTYTSVSGNIIYDGPEDGPGLWRGS